MLPELQSIRRSLDKRYVRNNMDEATGKVMVERLNLIIALMLRKEQGGVDMSVTDRIATLKLLGRTNSEIGQILGKSDDYVGTIARRIAAKSNHKRSRA